MQTEDLISELSADLQPVRRVWHPAKLMAAWCALSFSLIGLAVVAMGPRDNLLERLASSFDLPQLLTATATGLLAGFASFQLALPDGNRRWALLPIPAALAWLGTLGWGCAQDVARLGLEALRLTTSYPCLAFITAIGLPLTLGIVWLTRHAAPLRPGLVAALGGLSAAALSSVGLSLVHHLDAAAMVLAWHGLAVLLVTALSALAGPRLMQATS